MNSVLRRPFSGTLLRSRCFPVNKDAGVLGRTSRECVEPRSLLKCCKTRGSLGSRGALGAGSWARPGRCGARRVEKAAAGSARVAPLPLAASLRVPSDRGTQRTGLAEPLLGALPGWNAGHLRESFRASRLRRCGARCAVRWVPRLALADAVVGCGRWCGSCSNVGEGIGQRLGAVWLSPNIGAVWLPGAAGCRLVFLEGAQGSALFWATYAVGRWQRQCLRLGYVTFRKLRNAIISVKMCIMESMCIPKGIN